MAVSELESFVGKFRQLWNAGFTAHLDLDTHAGNAWVGLRVQLGHDIHGHGPLHNRRSSPKVSPSRLRRRARRLAARNAEKNVNEATEEVVSHSEAVIESTENTVETEIVENTIILENEVEKVVAENVIKAKENETENNQDENEAEKAEVLFKCFICDFHSTWENGLKIHLSRKHSKLEQVDGCDDSDIESVKNLHDDEKYERSEHYWKTGKIGIAYHVFLDANSIVEESNLSNEEKEIERIKILESRKDFFGKSFFKYPPWKKD